ncbi:hypothetical protein GBF38_019150 [Nibea albiflora]|uniref:Uncharacterized protein n=1 Tax=Nibea albiflora TaxID=240163 RepID=A0ACB7F0V9_NIBAL|nr:hypothetical protein GBF38_019150 [Nibea albiflora]
MPDNHTILFEIKRGAEAAGSAATLAIVVKSNEVTGGGAGSESNSVQRLQNICRIKERYWLPLRHHFTPTADHPPPEAVAVDEWANRCAVHQADDEAPENTRLFLSFFLPCSIFPPLPHHSVCSSSPLASLCIYAFLTQSPDAIVTAAAAIVTL